MMMDRNARLLASAGVVLLTLSLLNGFLVHVLPHARQALSAHLIGLIGSAFLMALAGLWPSLDQGGRGSRARALLAVYGFCGGWLINFLAALTGRFGLFPISAS